MDPTFKYFETEYVHPSYTSKPNFSHKETIKVLILVGSTFKTGNMSSSSSYIQKDGTVTNYPFDIWMRIQQELQSMNKYNFKLYLTDPSNINYTSTVKLLKHGNFDVTVALYTITNERLQYALPTLPIISDSLGVMYPRSNYANNKYFNLFKQLIGTFAVMIILGILMGFILHAVEPRRGRGVLEHLKDDTKYIRRSVLTAIAALFGELGYLSENSSLSLKGMFTVLIFFMFAYVFVAYIQTTIITTVLEDSDSFGISQNNIKKKSLIAIKGYADVEKLERYGKLENTKRIDGTISTLSKKLMESSQYEGAIVSMIDSFSTRVTNPSLTHANGDFDKSMKYFYVTPIKPYLRDDINIAIAKLTNSLELKKTCTSYFPNTTACTMLS